MCSCTFMTEGVPAMNIYVGNLALDLTEEQLREEFAAFGEVVSVSIVKDKHSGQSRGFGFVEMALKDEGEAAINALKGKILKGRTFDVSEAGPRSDRKGRRSYGGSRRGGSSGRGRQKRY